MGKADYLIINTVNDCAQLRAQLEQAKQTARRITERVLALADVGNPVAYLLTYAWPEGYTIDDFVELYTALTDLPGSVVEDTTRNAIYKILAYFQ